MNENNPLPHERMFYGGVLREQPTTGAEAKPAARECVESIRAGVVRFERRSRDFETVPGADFETFNLFDVATGEEVLVWRVQYRRKAH